MTFFCCTCVETIKQTFLARSMCPPVCEMYSSSDDDEDFSKTPFILKKWAEEVRNKRKRTCKFIK